MFEFENLPQETVGDSNEGKYPYGVLAGRKTVCICNSR